MYRAALSWRRRCGGSGGVFCRSPELLAMVRVNEKEATAITRHLGEHEGQAPLPLPVAVPGDAGWYRIPPSYVGGSCAYLDETGSCRLTSETSRNTAAHDSGSTPTQSPDLRPTPCRTFPLWPDALASEFDWFQRYPALARGALETIDTEAATKGAEEAAAAATAAAATDATDAADATDTIDGADAPTDPVNTISPAELARVLTHHCAYMSGDIDEFEYDEARALIEQLPEEDLEAFVTELEQTQTREVVYQDDEVTVLEAPCEPPPSLGAEADARVQCLYFNERPELIQSSMYLTEAPAHFLDQGGNLRAAADGDDAYVLAPEIPPPGDHHQALALSLALYLGRQEQEEAGAEAGAGAGVGGTEGSAAPRILVLGAGACVLPSYLRAVLPASDVTAVELSETTCRVAQVLFGAVDTDEEGEGGAGDVGFGGSACSLGRLRPPGSFRLVQADAKQYISEAMESSYDIIVVDIEDGSRGASTEGPELVAPPAWVIESGMLNHVARALAPGGVVALNVVGEERARQMVAEQLNRHFDDVFGCNAAPHDDGAEQREGAVFACAGTVTGALEMGTADAYRGQLRQGMSRLGLSEERPLVDDPDGWIDERLVTWPVR